MLLIEKYSPDGDTTSDITKIEVVFTYATQIRFANPDSPEKVFSITPEMEGYSKINNNYLYFVPKKKFPDDTKYKVTINPFELRSNKNFFIEGKTFFFKTPKLLNKTDVVSGEQIKTFTGDLGSVKSVSFSPDGKYAVSGSEYLAGSTENSSYINETLKLWNISTGRVIRTFKWKYDIRYSDEYDSFIKSVCFSPDGRYVLSGSDKSLKLWDVKRDKEIKSFHFHKDDGKDISSVNSVCFSSDGDHILSAIYGSLYIWDVKNGNAIKSFEEFEKFDDYISVVSPCFSPDNKYVLSGLAFYGAYGVTYNTNLILWDAQTGKKIKYFGNYHSNVSSVCFSPDGNYALSSSNNKLILWNVSDGKEIRSFIGHTDKVNSVCFSPDGKFVLSGSADHTIKLWNVSNGNEIKTFTGHMDKVNSVCCSPDGKFILSGSSDGTLMLWDMPVIK